MHAILSGFGGKRPRLEYLPEGFELSENVTVFTSGKDGIFPPGIPIGKTNPTEDIMEVKLFTDPDQLSFINIILTKSVMEKNF